MLGRVVTVLATLTLTIACASPDIAEDAHVDDENSSANVDRARNSEDFVAAEEAVIRCMEREGYFGNPVDGVTLKDGTYLRVQGTGLFITGAYLEYLMDEERCETSTGYLAIAERHGLQPDGFDPVRTRAFNERKVKQMDCLQGRGWAIPDPVRLRGALVYDKQFESEEERAAWVADWTQCNMQLFGNPTGWD